MAVLVLFFRTIIFVMDPDYLLRNNFIHAVKKNDISRVRDIFSKHPKHLKSLISAPRDQVSDRCPPMFYAVNCGHLEILQLLIELGGNVNERLNSVKHQIYNVTYLHFIASPTTMEKWDVFKKIAKVLIERGADVDAYSEFYVASTPLQLAVLNGHVGYVEMLLQNNAKFQEPEMTPLKFVLHAPKPKQKLILQLLIKYGLDTQTCDEETGVDYLMMTIVKAIKTIKEGSNEDVDVVEIAKTLLDSGVSANRFNECGLSSLALAIELQNVELVSVLIEKGANVNGFHRVSHNVCSMFSDPNAPFLTEGFNPLILAVHKGNEELVELLISNKADINAKNDIYYTALHEACRCKHENMIELLLRMGANVSAEDKSGQTPISLLQIRECKASDVPSIVVMVKEIAKKEFFRDTQVGREDLELIRRAHPVVFQLYLTYVSELDDMSGIKFYTFYTYTRVLEMSKNINTLANLVKNVRFVKEFKKHLFKFSHYESDLLRIFDEAVRIRNRLMIVDSRLKSAFGDHLPNLVLRKLAKNLEVEDLPLYN